MRVAYVLSAVLAISVGIEGRAAEHQAVYFLKIPLKEEASLGVIEKLEVIVSCSQIANLKNIPPLYDITMGYEMPVEHSLEARPRLGTAAVKLSDWTNVIGVRLPADADAKSCFKVHVRAEGRNGKAIEWSGPQMGVPD